MPRFEYKVVSAPVRAERAKGLKGTNARFANTVEALMNELGRDGWEYQRSDSLPCEERSGFTGRTTTFQNMLVFRREITDAPDVFAPKVMDKHEASPVIAAPSAGDAPSSRGPSVGAARPEGGAAPSIGSAKDGKSGVAAG